MLGLELSSMDLATRTVSARSRIPDLEFVDRIPTEAMAHSARTGTLLLGVGSTLYFVERAE